jgi:hypothetical protein
VKANEPAEGLRVKVKRTITQPRAVGVYDFVLYDKSSGIPLFPFVPDPGLTENVLLSVMSRVGRKMPESDEQEASSFVSFCRCFNQDKIVPPVDFGTFEEWLSGTSYGGPRKRALRDLRAKVSKLEEEYRKCQCFGKDEGYLEPKQLRPICSLTDDYKALLGQYVKKCDDTLFKLKYFVKHTNPRDWPELLRSTFKDENVMETDFSSFESHHYGFRAIVVREWLQHSLQNAPEWVRHFVGVLTGQVNTLRFKDVTCWVDERLMSGALWTSSANGYLNLMLMSYIILKSKYPELSGAALYGKFAEFVGLIEGDDGLTVSTSIDEKLIDKLGLKLKFEHHERYHMASFCGVVCDPDESAIVADPLKVLMNFFRLKHCYARSQKKVRMALYRAKALSYLCNYKNAPIIGPLAYEMCLKTKDFDARAAIDKLEERHAGFARLALSEKAYLDAPKITMKSRIVVERHFGFSVQEQLSIEEAIQSHGEKLVVCLGGCPGRITEDHFRNAKNLMAFGDAPGADPSAFGRINSLLDALTPSKTLQTKLEAHSVP